MNVAVILTAGCASSSVDDLPLGEGHQAVTSDNGINLNGINLNGINLNGINLNGINLNGINLNGINLNGINLNGINLNGVALNGLYINGINLNGINLNGIGLNEVGTSGLGTYGIALDGIGLDSNTQDAIGTSGDAVAGEGLRGVSINGLYVDGTGMYGIDVGGKALLDVALGGFGGHALEVNGTGPWGIGLGSDALAAAGLGNFRLFGRLPRHIGLENTGRPGYGLRGISLNGLFLDGNQIDTLTVDGRSLLDGGLNELAVNQTGANGIRLTDASGQAVALSAGQESSLEVALYHLIGCALPAGDAITITAADGTAQTYRGLRGLAPEWAEGALSQTGEERVRACIESSVGAYASTPFPLEHEKVLETTLFHLVGCALPAGESVTIIAADGTPKTYEGLRGLAPEWAGGAISQTGEERVRACIESSPDAVFGLALNAEQEAGMKKLLSYMVQCALPAGESVTIYAGDGTPDLYDGALGLAPEWATEPLSAAGELLVSACLAARSNAKGKTVRISLRGGGLQTTAVERDVYRHHEGAFWGNLFADTPHIYTCSVNGADISGRDCTGDACGFEYLGDCAAVCTSQDPMDSHYSGCSGETAVINTFLAITEQQESGQEHSCIVADDALWCWGDNSDGELGDGSFASSADPISITRLGRKVAEIGGGVNHSCARDTDGSVWCWGNNEHGQLGTGSTETSNPYPTHVADLGYDVASLGVASNHACALSTSGSVSCWGDNLFGQLGDGSTVAQNAPVPVAGLDAGVARISLGDSAQHTCAATDSGTLWCWGWNSAGQLGDGSIENRSTPVQVAQTSGGQAFGEVTDICAGWLHTCARQADGTLWCWGSNASGQLGTGSLLPTVATRPVQVALAGAVAPGTLSCGAQHTCAALDDGSLWCWGDNAYGQLGSEALLGIASPAPVQITDLTGPVDRVSTDAARTCATQVDGVRWCWGEDPLGLLFGEIGANPTAVQVATPTQHRYAPSGLQIMRNAAGHDLLRWEPHLALDLDVIEIYQDGILIDSVEAPRVRWKQENALSACYQVRAVFLDGTASSLSDSVCNTL